MPYFPPRPTLIEKSFGYPGVIYITTGLTRQYLDFDAQLAYVRAQVASAPVGGPVTVDLNYDGTTVFASTADQPSIAAAGFTALGLNLPATVFQAGHYFTCDIDAAGSTTPGQELVVTVGLRRL